MCKDSRILEVAILLSMILFLDPLNEPIHLMNLYREDF